MHSAQNKRRRFIVSNPDAALSRLEAIKLIHRHAEGVRVFEDLDGHQALMVTERRSRRLVLFADLSDQQILEELPEAWRREHAQSDLFANVPEDAESDSRHARNRTHWISRIWHSLTRGM